MIPPICTNIDGFAAPQTSPGVRRVLRMRYILVNAFCLLLAASHGAQATSSTSVVVQPASLSLNAMVNEPVVLQLEVSGQSDLGDIDIKAQGIRIQREIKKPAANRRVFWIEPDTSTAGRINGSIAVMDKQGKVLSTVSVSGEVKPHIRVSPSRIFLGSLEYGTTSGRKIERRFRLSKPGEWKVTSVDTSEIPGAQHEIAELEQGAKELRLRFTEDALKEGEPFGAFINRTVRINTDVAAQPDMDLPLTAMLSKNGTSRDFNTFVFKGNERWQGKWATPNLAAAVMGPLVLLALGYGIWLWRIRMSPAVLVRGVASVLCASSLFGMLLLAMTYSRGGWLAFGIGLAAMFVLTKGARPVIAVAAVIFASIVVLSPAGVQRAASASAIGEDGSIRNRLLVWRGALEMIADNPTKGVGAGRFAEMFQSCYQEPWHRQTYSTAINDYLTFAAERGLVIVLAALSASVSVASMSAQFARRSGDGWIAPIIAGLITLAANSAFSSIQFVTEVRIVGLLFMSILAAYCALRNFSSRLSGGSVLCPRVRGVWCRSIFCGLGAAFIFASPVAWANSTRSVRHAFNAGEPGKGGSVATVQYLPGHTPARGTVIFLPQESEPLNVIGRNVLRPLAQIGWRAVSLDLSAYDQEAAAVVQDLLGGVTEPIILVAEKSKARVAAAVALHAPNTHRLRIGLIAPVLFSSLSECDKSSGPGVPAQHLVIIDDTKWKEFKNYRSLEVQELNQVLYHLANVSSVFNPSN